MSTAFLYWIISTLNSFIVQINLKLLNSKTTVRVNTEQERGDRPSDYARREDESPPSSKSTRSANFGMFYFRFTCKDQPDKHG